MAVVESRTYMNGTHMRSRRPPETADATYSRWCSGPSSRRAMALTITHKDTQIRSQPSTTLTPAYRRSTRSPDRVGRVPRGAC